MHFCDCCYTETDISIHSHLSSGSRCIPLEEKGILESFKKKKKFPPLSETSENSPHFFLFCFFKKKNLILPIWEY